MKILEIVSSHKVTTLITAGVLAIGVGGYFIASKNVEEVKKEVHTVKESKINTPEESVEVVEQEQPVVENTIIETPKKETPPSPINQRTIQDIAMQYPSLTGTDHLQSCFDAVVAKYPDRFSAGVREDNIKSLTLFTTSCATGIFTDRPVIESYGANGAFFDSGIAKSVL